MSKSGLKLKPYKRSFAGRLTQWIMLTLLLIMAAITIALYGITKNAMVDEAKNRFRGLMDITNEKLGNALMTVELSMANEVSDVEENVGNPDKILSIMRRVVQHNPNITGCGIGYEPDYFSDKGKWFEPYVKKIDGDSVEVSFIGSVSHNYHEADWYLGAKDSKEGYWTEPYYDAAGGKMLLLTYSVPVRDEMDRCVAVMGTDISLDWLKLLIDNIDDLHQEDDNLHLYDFYSFVITRDGSYIVHPDPDRVLQRNLLTEVRLTPDSMDDRVIQDMLDLKRGEATMNVDGVLSYVFYAPLETAGWSMAIVVPKKSFLSRANVMGGIVLLLMALGLLVIYFVSHTAIKRITMPLTRFAASAAEVAHGNFDAPLPVIKSYDEIQHLRDSFEDMQHSLSRYVEDLRLTTASKVTMESELKIASEIQTSMLPKQFPPFPDRSDIDIYGQLTPARAVGGDLYDFFIRDEKLFFCIGDVSGKSVPAAIVMAMTCSLFRNISAREDSPDRILISLNETMAQGNDSNMFVTMFIGVLDLKSGRLLFSNAGHGAPMLIGLGIGWLHCDSNIPIGLKPGWQYTLQEALVAPMTTIFLYTDGLSEAEDINHRQFGNHRIVKKVVKRLLEENRHHPRELIDQMTESVYDFIGEAEQSDDLTMLAIQFTRQPDLLLQQSVVLPNDVQDVPRLASFVSQACEAAGINDIAATQINLALEEAVVNVMKYAYPAGVKGDVRVEATVSADQLQFVISDGGQPFDPTVGTQVDTTLGTNERGIGGLGIHLVRNFMDDVRYERMTDRNILTLTKKL